ncbi:MAG: NAD(P)/FAD-dependent oxidoreductase [Acidimicrobiales bacterium]|jgi:cation diffusion facilitator CzcD-associated flavoprotein CzcO|nr:NAD(P)/FAD-dependent oxidoreductase [Acidimicrobiales bacterium]
MHEDEIRERYERERQKRLRDDGLAQYVDLTGQFEDFDIDPWVEPGFTRDAITKDVTVVIVGGGFAGMLAAVELTRRGICDFHIIEKGGDFGGTWYWNRYPGCMCDVESYTYMPLLEETGYMPTEKYASAPEIFEHCQRIGNHFDLYPHALFQTDIDDATWDDKSQRWTVTTSRGDSLTSRFFVTAGGILHKAKLPGIPGIQDYAGRTFHTARWDYDFTGGAPREPMDKLDDKRVGIIGTGATAIQVVPQLGRAAKDVYVFQRTPSAVGVRNNGPTDEAWYRTLEPGWQDERMRNFTQAVTGEKPLQDLVGDGWTEVLWEATNQTTTSPEHRAELEQSDMETMAALRKRVDEEIDDPETAEKLKPWYGKHCKRVCFHDDYLPAFNRPNVHLVDTDGAGVREIGSRGPIVDGVEYPVDLLIFASGFEVTTPLAQRLGFDPAGRGGVRLSERWQDGAHTLHGIFTAEFPNMLVMSTVQAGFGTNFVHFLSQSAIHVASVIRTCLDEDIATIEATPEAEEEWLATLYEVAIGLAHYSATCIPGYYNSEGATSGKGARNLVYPGSLLHYAGYLERWRDAGDMPGARVVRA